MENREKDETDIFLAQLAATESTLASHEIRKAVNALVELVRKLESRITVLEEQLAGD